MTEKRFTDDGIEDIENQSFTDNLTEKTYWTDNGLDDIVELLNNLHNENEKLKNKLKFFSELNEPYGTIIGENERLKKENERLKRENKDLEFFRYNVFRSMEKARIWKEKESQKQ